jgi:hypothetical protein
MFEIVLSNGTTVTVTPSYDVNRGEWTLTDQSGNVGTGVMIENAAKSLDLFITALTDQQRGAVLAARAAASSPPVVPPAT